MKKLLFIPIIFFLCTSAWSASITSTQTGNWSSGSTWVGGTAPGDGDTAIIADGHTVTIQSGSIITVGASPDDDVSTPAIDTASASGTGILVVNGTLIFRGTIKQSAVWVVGAGATLRHDSSQATTPSSTHYSWQIGKANDQDALLDMNGSSGSRISVENAASSGTFRGFHAGYGGIEYDPYPAGTTYSGAGQIDAEYVTFDDVGYSGHPAFSADLGGAGDTWNCDHCLIKNSGGINFLPKLNASANFQFTNSSILDPDSTVSLILFVQNALSGGTRLMQDSIIEGQFKPYYVKDLTVDHCAFSGADSLIPIGGSSTKLEVASFDDCLIYNHSTDDKSIAPRTGTINRLISLRTPAGSDNDRDHLEISGTVDANFKIDGGIFEYSGNATAGDIFVFYNNPSSSRTADIKNILALPNASYFRHPFLLIFQYFIFLSTV